MTLASLDGSLLGAIDDTLEDELGDESKLDATVDASAVDAVMAASSVEVANGRNAVTVVMAVVESCVGCSVVVVGIVKAFAVVASRRGS